MEILLFGVSREIVGKRTLQVDSSENVHTVGGLKYWMKQKYPALANLNSLAIAVDSEYAEDDQDLVDENEIAIIPPVSGG